VATYLDEILAHHRREATRDGRDLAMLAARAAARPPGRAFRAALSESVDIAVIAEIKRRSPSKGDLVAALDPASLALSYAAGGASCLSVLTDSVFFGGSPADLAAARGAVDLPVLRKDFTVSAADVFDAAVMGADALLLIVAALTDGELEDLHGLAEGVGLDVLVEVHDEDELARALSVGASLIGVNQRDLHTFSVDTERAVRVGAAIPDGVVSVAESGITGRAEVERLAEAGFDAILVGEALVTAPDPGAALVALGGGQVRRRAGDLAPLREH
jgi:indole-3-glycerol phosphate synthase